VISEAPGNKSEAAARHCVRELWQFVGSSVIEMNAADHDRALAQTSHMPHVVAAALAASVPESVRQFVATGVLDATRIAAGDPQLWAAILRANAGEVLQSIDGYRERLREFRQAIAAGDDESLRNLLQAAKSSRDRLGERRRSNS
jgi:prephenate dehydrogenase